MSYSANNVRINSPQGSVGMGPSSIGPNNSLWEQNSSPSMSPLHKSNSASFTENNSLYNNPGIYTVPNSNFSETVSNIAEKAATDVIKGYRITKQFVNEKYGQGQKTIDQEVQQKLMRLKDDKTSYTKLLKMTNQYAATQKAFLKSQMQLGEFIKELALVTPEASDGLINSGDTLTRISNSSQNVLLSITRFTDNIQTLVEKTMTDSIASASRLQTTRLEFDAIRSEIDDQQRKHGNGMVNVNLHKKFIDSKEMYTKQREEFLVKLQLLDENRIRVLKNSLENFNTSNATYIHNCDNIISLSEHNMQQLKNKEFNGYDNTPGLPGQTEKVDENDGLINLNQSENTSPITNDLKNLNLEKSEDGMVESSI